MNVCQARLRSPRSGHVATVPGKFLNNNCNVVFEGEFLVAHQFELAVVTSQEHGYWMPIPPDGDLRNALTSTPGPDGKAYTICTAKTFTDTPYVKNALDAGVRWHGHHIGNLNAKKECVTEWGGSSAVSGIDVRVYFVGGPPTFAVPTSDAWYSTLSDHKGILLQVPIPPIDILLEKQMPEHLRGRCPGDSQRTSVQHPAVIYFGVMVMGTVRKPSMS
jgi:hypothetical protein